MKAVLFDYRVGNIHSLTKALEAGGASVRVEDDPAQALDGDALVLPGVGAFGAAAARLEPAREAIRRALDDGFPCLGVCLGMQLLFEESEESDGSGLGALPGRVRRLRARRVPHMGWNAVRWTAEDGRDLVAYYANSFAVEPADEADVAAWTEYDGDRFPAVVRRNRTWGTQFHPEKSGSTGLELVRRFLEEARR